MFHLGGEFDPVFFSHRIDYHPLQSDNLLREGVSRVIDYHKGLSFPNCGTSPAFALPAATLYQPGGRDLH